MSAPVDISAEAVERLAGEIEPVECYSSGNCPKCGEYNFSELKPAAATLRALRAALDAAERERRQALDLAERHMNEKHKAQKRAREDWNLLQERIKVIDAERDAADATGYARGVRDAANTARYVANRNLTAGDAERAILALLPDATKETRDAE